MNILGAALIQQPCIAVAESVGSLDNMILHAGRDRHLLGEFAPARSKLNVGVSVQANAPPPGGISRKLLNGTGVTAIRRR